MQTLAVNQTLFNQWLVKNSPNAEAKLSAKSGVSVSTIRNMKTGKVPMKITTRIAIAEATGNTHDNLFFTTITTTTSNNGNQKGVNHGSR